MKKGSTDNLKDSGIGRSGICRCTICKHKEMSGELGLIDTYLWRNYILGVATWKFSE